MPCPTAAMRNPVWRPAGFFLAQLALCGRMQASSETKQGLPNVSAAMRWATFFRLALSFDVSTRICERLFVHFVLPGTVWRDLLRTLSGKYAALHRSAQRGGQTCVPVQGRCDILAPHGPEHSDRSIRMLVMWIAASAFVKGHAFGGHAFFSEAVVAVRLRRIAVQAFTLQATILERFAPPFQNSNLRCLHTTATTAAFLRFIGASQCIGNRSVGAVGG